MAISADEVKRLVENVAAVSEESAAAIEQVAASIREMASASDQVSSSAQDLAGQAETLQNIVGNFKIYARAKGREEAGKLLIFPFINFVFPLHPIVPWLS